MLYCILRYNVGFYDYHIFGFAHIHGAKARNTFFTMQDNWRLTRMVNSPEDRPYFENKLLFCRTFAPYLGRSFLDLNEAGDTFCGGRPGHKDAGREYFWQRTRFSARKWLPFRPKETAPGAKCKNSKSDQTTGL